MIWYSTNGQASLRVTVLDLDSHDHEELVMHGMRLLLQGDVVVLPASSTSVEQQLPVPQDVVPAFGHDSATKFGH